MEAECFWRAGKSHEQVSAKNERGYKKERQGQAVIIWTGNHGWNATGEIVNVKTTTLAKTLITSALHKSRGIWFSE